MGSELKNLMDFNTDLVATKFLRPSYGPARIINGFVRAQKYMVRGCR